jgi:hypothetical protein
VSLLQRQLRPGLELEHAGEYDDLDVVAGDVIAVDVAKSVHFGTGAGERRHAAVRAAYFKDVLLHVLTGT